MATKDEVWHYMLDHQEQNGAAPKMDEIQGAFPNLAWRSSVRYTLQGLLEDGRVVETDDPGTARRYRAVPHSEGTDLVSAPVMVIPLED